ncbi:MAG: phage tail protein [Sphingomicrobium sp.]
MATLILTTVGTALAGPIGGAFGSLVGQSIDQGLFGSGKRRAPHLGDLSVQTSSYGSSIPRIYGRMRVAGTVVWATDLKEEEVIEGGGKSGPEQLSYSYSVNLAVALSSRPIRSVSRIWADGKLIRGAAGDLKVKTKFRLMPGSQDQAIDPLIASIEGVEGTPAYRGLALAIFENLDLAEFGNRIPMLTFEVEADEPPVALADMLRDASGGLIEVLDETPVVGYAAYGSSIGDSLGPLITVNGLLLADRDGRLTTVVEGSPTIITETDLGCDAGGGLRPRLERRRAPASSMPDSMAISYYDPERDYQASQVLAGSAGGTGADRIELPAVMSASIAKQLAEACLARRWQAGDSLKLWLPPSRLELIPGDAFQIEGDARAWIVRSASIDGMVVELDAVAAPSTIQALPADPGRPVAEPDEIIGRSQLALFELPAEGGAPDEAPTSWIAATSAGKWKSIPIELSLAASPLAGIVLGRRAIIGKAETVLDARCPMIIDEASRVIVRLVNAAQILLNADQDAMMAGANLALLGDELIQFGRAEQLDPGLFRLSHLLRGRRGTEWAAAGHAVEDVFCLMNAATIRSVDLPGSSVGAELRAIAHGVGDAAPLPVATRLVSGEAMRPPSPCHVKAIRAGSNLSLSWVRRSFRGWTWSDGVGDVPDSYPEHYRVTLQGPAGQTIVDTANRSILFDPSQVPGSAGESIDMAVATIGAAAVSHSATQTIML